MKAYPLVAISILAIACGCNRKPESNATGTEAVPVVRTTVSTTSNSKTAAPKIHINLPSIAIPKPSVEPTQPTPVDLAVRHGAAKRAGPITPERFAIWKAHAELCLELDLQGRRVAYQQHILDVIDDREHSFLLDAEQELKRSGLTLERHLRSFDDLRQKFRARLREAEEKHRELTTLLATWERQHLNPQPFNPFEGVPFMKDPLHEIVTPSQVDVLALQGVTDARGLALTFLRQPDQLARLLNVDEAKAIGIVQQAAKHVPRDELKELSDLAERIEQIPPGVEPPDERGGDQ